MQLASYFNGRQHSKCTWVLITQNKWFKKKSNKKNGQKKKCRRPETCLVLALHASELPVFLGFANLNSATLTLYVLWTGQQIHVLFNTLSEYTVHTINNYYLAILRFYLSRIKNQMYNKSLVLSRKRACI